MSKIAITPNASGTGTFTIAAPAGSTDRTLTLPDAAGAVVIDEAGGGSVKIDSSGNMGIGITPAVNTTTKLTVAGDITMSGNSRGILGNLYFASGWKYAANGNAWGIIEGNGNLQFYNAPENSSGAGAAAAIVQRMRIDSAGRVTMPYQPAFEGNGSGSITAAQYTVLTFNNSTLNRGSHFNGTSFTAPVSGVYEFHGRMEWNGSSNFTGSLYLAVNGTTVFQFLEYGSGNYNGPNFSALIYLSENDYVQLWTFGNNSGSGPIYSNRFGGYLIG